jgi:hypothetical protein
MDDGRAPGGCAKLPVKPTSHLPAPGAFNVQTPSSAGKLPARCYLFFRVAYEHAPGICWRSGVIKAPFERPGWTDQNPQGPDKLRPGCSLFWVRTFTLLGTAAPGGVAPARGLKCAIRDHLDDSSLESYLEPVPAPRFSPNRIGSALAIGRGRKGFGCRRPRIPDEYSWPTLSFRASRLPYDLCTASSTSANGNAITLQREIADQSADFLVVRCDYLGAQRVSSWSWAANDVLRRGKPGRHAASRLGDPRALDKSNSALAQRMHANGESASTIATTLGVSRATVYRVLAEPTAEGD